MYYLFCINALLIFLLLAGCNNLTSKEQNSFNKNEKINTVAADYNVQLGLAYLVKGDRQRAKMKLLTANQQNPHSVSVKLALAYFWEQVADYKEAEQEYQLALKIAPKSGSVHNNYGVFLCQHERYKLADKHFRLALLDKNYLKSGELYENAGVCAMRMGEFRLATNYFKHAIEHDLYRPVTYFNLAKIELQLNNCLEADRWYMLYRTKEEALVPEALLLGYHIARCLYRDAQANHYMKLLRKHFPRSEEYLSLVE